MNAHTPGRRRPRPLAPRVARGRVGTLLLSALLLPGVAGAQFSPELRGRVRDAATGAPLAAATLHLESGETATSRADGGFQLRASATGDLALRVRRIGYAPLVLRVTLANGRVTEVQPRLVPQPVRLDSLVAVATAEPGALVVDRAQLAAAGVRDLADAVQQLPGVVVTRRGGPGAPATVSIRGASADQVLVLLDGVPLNDPLTGTADLSRLPSYDLERVTVLPGARSARYGARALGGVILAESRQAAGRGVEVGGEAGRFGDRTAEGGAELPLGGSWQLRATGLRRTSDNRFGVTLPPERGGGTAERLNADLGRTQATLDLHRSRPDGGLRLRAEWGDGTRGMPGAIVQPSVAARQRDQRRAVTAAWDAERGAWALHADAALQWQGLAFRDSAPPFGRAYADTARVAQQQLRASVQTTRGAWTLRALGDVQRLALRSTTLDGTAPGTLHAAGLGVAAERALALGAWQALASAELRVDAATQLSGPLASPRATLRADRDRLGLSAAWGFGFAPPAPADLFFRDGVQVAPNPGLRPERVRHDVSLAAELRAVPVGPLRADVALTAFRADVDGLILWAPDFRFVWSPRNFDVTRRGGELQLNLRAPGAGALGLAVAHAAVRYTGGVLDGQVIYRPAWTATATADTRTGPVALGGTLRWTASRRTAPGSTLNLLPAFAVLDLRAQHVVTARPGTVTVRAGVENLLNQRTGMLADFPDPGRRWIVGVRLATTRGSR